MTDIDDWDEASFREWMHAHFLRAEATFGVTVDGDLLYGWNNRSVSAAVVDHDGERRWLRVGSERNRDIGPYWTGNLDANLIEGIAKPRVIAHTEWDAPELDRRVRTDLMTWMPGKPCSSTEFLQSALSYPESWWDDLRETLKIIHTTATNRYRDRTPTAERVRDAFGDAVASEVLSAAEPQTVHGDFHWANIFGPKFAIADFEMWGIGVKGADEAALYLRSLLVPPVARHVYELFSDVLDTPTGRAAQLRAAAVLIFREAEWPDLAAVARAHARTLMKDLRAAESDRR